MKFLFLAILIYSEKIKFMTDTSDSAMVEMKRIRREELTKRANLVWTCTEILTIVLSILFTIKTYKNNAKYFTSLIDKFFLGTGSIIWGGCKGCLFGTGTFVISTVSLFIFDFIKAVYANDPVYMALADDYIRETIKAVDDAYKNYQYSEGAVQNFIKDQQSRLNNEFKITDRETKNHQQWKDQWNNFNHSSNVCHGIPYTRI